MSKKFIFILSFVLLLLSLAVNTTPVLGADNNDWWTPRTVPSDFSNYQDDWHGGEGTGGNTGSWFTPGNWAQQRSSTASPPDPYTTAEIEPKPLGPNIITTGATCARLDVQPWAWAGAPNIDCNISENAGLVDCGLVLNVCGRTDFDSSSWGYGKLNVYGGTIYTPGIWPGAAPGGQIDQIGLYVGGGASRVAACYGIVNMYGGFISVPRVAVYNGIVNLYGGTIEDTHPTSADFIIANRYARNMINITNGRLLLWGNRISEVEDFCDQGLLVPCNNRGFSRVLYSYASGQTTVTAFCDWGASWNPNPTNNQLECPMSPATPLSWTPGDYVNNVSAAIRVGWGQVAEDTNGHRVYLGTSFNDVDSCNPSNPGPVTATSAYRGAFDANDTNKYDINDADGNRFGPLAFNTTYYWRVDEVNVGNPGSPWRGVVWHFTTSSGKAYNPYPPNDSNIGFDVNRLYMTWTKGLLADTVKGHRVFFGTDYNSVRDANTSTPVIYRGERTDANYPLSALSPDYTLVSEANYYWRIDENKTGDIHSPWKGNVWHFVFPNNYIVDNFSRYTLSADLNNIWKGNYLSGSCPGSGYSGPGATLILDQAAGAMTIDYNNTGLLYDCYSDARFTPFGTSNVKGLDYIASTVPSGPVKLLHISYRGLADNNVDPTYDRMYVMIADANTKPRYGPVYYNSDPNAQRKTSWQDWYIKLTDLNSPNPYPVDLKNIRYLWLGFGLRCNIYGSTPGGHGQVTFDNIWVTQPICIARYGPAADFSDDCFVDITDLDLFSTDWLLTDNTLSYPSAVAPSAAPVLWYDFNETTGTIAHNTGSSGSTYDANVINYSDGNTWNPSGRIAGCINLIYGKNTYVNVPAAVLAPFADVAGPNGITFTFWLNADSNYPPTSEWPAILSASTTGVSPGTESIEIEGPTPEAPPNIHVSITQILNGSNMRVGDFGNRWNHYAVVKDTNTHTMYIYENGAQIASTTREDIIRPLLSATPLIFKIGERYGWDPSMVARIDDVRMYGYALDANEVAWIATNGTKSIFVPLAEPSNLKTGSSPERVDFGDFALFANQWLTEQLWP